jgi:4-amino-4-deoxy-L-arabinose transferase-like glycosyltransferase
MSSYRGLLSLIPFCLVLFYYDLDGNDLWSAHEARAAQDAQRMLDDHSWGLPRLFDGQADLQKPPGFYWMVAAIGALNDGIINRWSVRLPAAIAGLLTVFMIYGYLARRGRPLAGFIAALVLASSIHFTSSARTGRIDMPLTCAITAALMVLSSDRKGLRNVVASGLCLGAAAFLKGPIGIALPISVLTACFVLNRLRGAPSDSCYARRLMLTSGIGTLLAVPWFLWANHETGGEFFRVFFWHHNVERALGDSPMLAIHPWWYYVPRFAIDFLPWTPLLVGGIVLFARKCGGSMDHTAVFGIVWASVMIGVLSLSRFKRADYLLPAFPGAAIFVGCVCESWYRQLNERRKRVAAIAFFGTLAGCLAGWWWFHQYVEPRQQAVREQAAFALHVRQLAPRPQAIILFRVESHLLAYHLGRPLHTLVEWAELDERLAAPGRHYFVTRLEFVDECRQNVRTRSIEVVALSSDFSAAAPLRPLVLMQTVEVDGKPNEPDSCPTNRPKD